MGLCVNIGNDGIRAVRNVEYIDKYAMIRESPTGKGFADLVLVSSRDVDLAAIVLELK